MRTILIVAILLGSVGAASGQFAVVEVGQALVQAITQSTRLAETVRNQLEDLAPLESLVLQEDYHTALALLRAVIQELSGLGWSVEDSLRRFDELFGEDQRPTTMAAYRARREEVRRLILQSRRDEIMAQSAMTTLLGCAERIARLLAQLVLARGNLSALQTLGQSLSELTRLGVESQVGRLTHERAEALQAADDVAADADAQAIVDKMFESWGK